MRRRFSRGALILSRIFLVAVGLLLAEFILRTIGNYHSPIPFMEPDRIVGWKNKPGSYDLTNSVRVIHMTFWDGGQRATRQIQKHSGPKVIFFGDSFTQGYGLSDEDTFAWKLQQMIPKLDIENFGVGGYGTWQVYLLMSELFGKQCRGCPPKFVFYLFSTFQEYRNVAEPGNVEAALTQPRGHKSLLYHYVDIDSNGNLIEHVDESGPTWTLSSWSRIVAFFEQVYRSLEARNRIARKTEVTYRILERINQQITKLHSQFVVILFAVDNASKEKYIHFFQEKNIGFVDCSSPLYERKEYRQKDGHPNGKMNSVIADCLSAVIKKLQR